MKLYGTVHALWSDPWGFPHHVAQIVQVVEVVQAGTFPYNNGYTTENNRVFVDDSGATYVAVPPIDFGASTRYLRRPITSQMSWCARPPARSIDKNGAPWSPPESDK